MATTKKSTPVTNVEQETDFLQGSGYAGKRVVTLSSWKWEDGKPKFFKVLGPVHEGTGKKGSNVPPPSLCIVRDLETKTHYQLILGKMILDAFTDGYPGNTIVGKCFGAIRYSVPDATWKRYDVREIETPEDEIDTDD